MCFLLYAGSNAPIPCIAWDDSAPAFHCQELSEHVLVVRKHFQSTQIMHVGSDHHCGCGFRHATYQNGEWPEEEFFGADWFDSSSDEYDYESNHQRLHDFVESLLRSVESVELYGCWSGDEDKPLASSLPLAVGNLISPSFVFRERGLYKVAK